MTQDRAQLLITAVDQTRSAFDSIRGNLAKLGDESNRVKGMLAGLGVSLSVAGFAAMIKSAIDAADQLNKLSQKIGISVEALSTLRFAAQLSDVSLETLQKGIKGLSQNITEANTGRCCPSIETSQASKIWHLTRTAMCPSATGSS